MKKLLSLILSFIIIAIVIFIPPVSANAIDFDIEYNAGDRIIVSLGDSYSSGEGIDPFFGCDLPLVERVRNYDWLCHRSQNAWSGKLTLKSSDGKTINMKDHRGSAGKAGNWYFAAMSGAVTGNILDTGIIPAEDKEKKEYEYRFKKYYKITGFNYDWFYPINSKVEYLEGSVEIPPQLTVFEELGDKKADYVTITMGGNDVDFTGVVTTAVVNVPYLEYSSHNLVMMAAQPIANGILLNKLDKMVNELLPDTIKRLEETYKRIAQKAGNQAHIIVAGYPKIISKDSIDLIFTSSDAELINSKVSYFNNEIRKTVEKCQGEGLNISFVSVEEEFGDYGAYYPFSSKELINRIDLVKEQDINDKSPVSAYSIHPNNKGAEAYANCVQREINRIESERTRIWGQVVDNNNKSISGVKVILTDDNNEVNITNTTDSNGNYGFELDYKKDRHYTVRFEKKEYETLEVTEDKGGNRITINATLKKDIQEKTYAAYLEEIKSLINEYGNGKVVDENNGNGLYKMTGLCYAKLIDFNNDGSEELLCVYGPAKDVNGYERPYYMKVFGYDGSNVNTLFESGAYSYVSEPGIEFSFKIAYCEDNGQILLLTRKNPMTFTILEWSKFTGTKFEIVKSISTFDESNPGNTVLTVDGKEVSEEEFNKQLAEWENKQTYIIFNSNSKKLLESNINETNKTLELLGYTS